MVLACVLATGCAVAPSDEGNESNQPSPSEPELGKSQSALKAVDNICSLEFVLECLKVKNCGKDRLCRTECEILGGCVD